MTSERRTELELPALLSDLYVESAPSYRFDVLAQTSRMRQRPRWTFPERWLPMALVRRRTWAPALPMRPVLIVAAILLLLVGLLIFQAAGRRSVPPPYGIARNGEIVYVVDGDVYARDSVDAPARLLIGGDAVDEAPTFSRRGDKFVFVRGTAVGGPYALWVADADGSAARELVGPLTDIDSWDVSPDGSTVVVSSRGADRRMQLELIPLDGSPSTVLPLGVQATSPRFRPPDGAWILFLGGDPKGRSTPYLVRADGSGLRELEVRIKALDPDHDFKHGMDWTGDGSQLAFVAVDDDLPRSGVESGLRIDIATVASDGSVIDQRRVEFDPTADHELNPNFLPGTGKLLYNTRNRDVDTVSIGVPGVRGGTSVGPASTTLGGIDYVISPDAKTALAYYWTEQTTYLFDLTTMQSRPIGLGTTNTITHQRLAP